MNIFIVSDQYYPIGGGIQQYLRGLSRQLTAWGHQVRHLTRAIEGCPEEEMWPEGRVIRTPLLLDAVPNPHFVLERWLQLVPLIEAVGPDVVYANHHTSVATIKACQRLGVPVVYGCHGWGLLCPLKTRFLKPDNSLCFNERNEKSCFECYKMAHSMPRVRSVRSAISRIRWVYRARKDISEKVVRYDSFQEILDCADARIILAKTWTKFFAPDNTFHIPLGIDVNLFHPVPAAPFRRKYSIEGTYVLVTSRIHNTKGQDWAIRALAHLPEEMKLVLAGNSSLFAGPKHEDNVHTRRARELIEELGLRDRVIFTGFLNTEELIQAYSGAAATLVPSVWLDPYPTVTLEAMACSCPVVLTANSGTAELVTDSVEGYVVPRMDPEAIAEAVLKILPHREEMGKAVREKVVRELNWPKIAGGVLEVLKMVIESKQSRPYLSGKL